MFLQALDFHKADGVRKKIAADWGSTKFAVLERVPRDTSGEQCAGRALEGAKHVNISLDGRDGA